MAQPGVEALIGSYDDEPAQRSTVSLFKNLSHHYFHQRSGPYVTTFWGGCGFIRRESLLAAGGFNDQRQGITDVELGYRLAARGIRVRLDPAIQVKHLKLWTLPGLLRTEFKVRAIPWTTLLLEFGYLPRGLNFALDQRAAAIVACLMVVSAFASVIQPRAVFGLILLVALAAIINRRLFGLFYRRGGLRLMIAGFLLQQLYYLYSIAGLAVGMIRHWLGIAPPRAGGKWRNRKPDSVPRVFEPYRRNLRSSTEVTTCRSSESSPVARSAAAKMTVAMSPRRARRITSTEIPCGRRKNNPACRHRRCQQSLHISPVIGGQAERALDGYEHR